MNYLIIGYQKSGKSASKLLLDNGHNVFVYDQNVNIVVDGLAKKVDTVDDNLLKIIDMCVVSPGVPLDSTVMSSIYEKNIKVIGELELGYTFHKKNLLAITGTNGKTTAVSLLAHIIKGSSAVGNIGTPITSATNDKTLVVEVSSFQLSCIDKFRPHIAGITYIDCDHLDYHKTQEAYIYAKHSIAKNMTKKDYLVLNSNDPNSMRLALNTKAKVYTYSTNGVCRGAYQKDGKIYFIKNFKPRYVMDAKDINLIGEHNLANTLLAITMAILHKVPIKKVRERVKTFCSLAHRMQKIAEQNGVTYINDSKATNISATLVALDCFDKNIVLLIGGSYKGYEYNELIKKLDKRVKKLIIFGGVKDRVEKACKEENFSRYIVCENLFTAVEMSKSISKSGDVVLLSPASASHDEFRNYEERGKKFEEYVLSKN